MYREPIGYARRREGGRFMGKNMTPRAAHKAEKKLLREIILLIREDR